MDRTASALTMMGFLNFEVKVGCHTDRGKFRQLFASLNKWNLVLHDGARAS